MAQAGRLHGKVAIVTGAAGGIGEAICERFLAEGSKVMMVGRNLENLQSVFEKLNVKYKENVVAMIQCDVAEENSASEVFTAVSNQFGEKCNVLVNNAGVQHVSPIVETTMASFNQVLDINLMGAFTFTREFLRRLEIEKNKDLTGANIINISSLAEKLGFENCSAYAASKAGLVAFTKTTCIEVGKFGVRCNAVSPGVIDTPMLNSYDSALLDAVRPMVPMGRFGKPVEVANVCLFLASDESSYITGATLEVSGGFRA